MPTTRKQARARHSPFSHLPLEIYHLIVNEAVKSGDIASLKRLRLVSKQFASNPAVLGALFRKVTLTISPDRLMQATSVMLPYVKNITFQPTEYAWGMTRTIFREIQNIASTSRVPPTKDEVDAGFEKHMLQANRLRELFESGKLARSWGNMMSRMGEGVTFEVGDWAFQPSKLPSRTPLECVAFPHRHLPNDKKHNVKKCALIYGSFGEKLFDTVIASLITAKVRPKGLIIRHQVRGGSKESYMWAHDGRLDQLDLSNLQTLWFQPQIPRWDDHDDPFGHKALAIERWRLSSVVTNLLEKTASSLREFYLFPYRNYVMGWPIAERQIIALPQLRKMRTYAVYDMYLLADLVRQAPHLNHLTMYGRPLPGNWREFFRAIRYHPSRMILSMREIVVNYLHGLGRWDLNLKRYDTAARSTRKHYQNNPFNDTMYSLENYISNHGKWSKTCDFVFLEENAEHDWANDWHYSLANGRWPGLPWTDDYESDEEEIRFWKGDAYNGEQPIDDEEANAQLTRDLAEDDRAFDSYDDEDEDEDDDAEELYPTRMRIRRPLLEETLEFHQYEESEDSEF
ncbi:unnamed protein product [Periconia digitata]|uniref:Uncharacterized protein n=1 Tax=Periconia digitata TaxID=1303443 RepID=A0A9W4UFZ1_9PLEO|nr:unnamed protein product [Periconia digitata]